MVTAGQAGPRPVPPQGGKDTLMKGPRGIYPVGDKHPCEKSVIFDVHFLR